MVADRGYLRDPKDGVAWLAVLLAFVSVAFGGEHRNNPLGVGVMAFVATPLLGLGLWTLIDGGGWRRYRWPLVLLGLCWVVLLIQLVPVPLSLYATVPGRAQATTALDLAGLRPALLPISMNPAATWAAVLGSLPPTAMFLAVLGATGDQRRRLILAYSVLVVLAIALALAQMTTRSPALYPYSRVIPGEFVGFFANRNHQATLLLAALPLSAVWPVRRRDEGSLAALFIPAAACLVALFALAAGRSRFGVLLAIPVSAMTLGLAAARLRVGGRLKTLLLAGVLVLGLALSIILPLGLAPILERFTGDTTQISRVETWRRSLEVADVYSPFGAGVGAFDRVYRAMEAPDAVRSTYVNAAHNDYVQVFLEAGVPGIILVVALIAAIGFAGWRAWRLRGEDGAYARAATTGLAVVVLHSAVDYPLRTGAVAVLAAFLMGVLARETADRRG